MDRKSDINPEIEAPAIHEATLTGFKTGEELAPEQLEEVERYYEATHYRRADSPQTVGLFGEDVGKSVQNPKTILGEYKVGAERIVQPLFVPVESVYWYNKPLLRETYGDDTEIYYFTHADLPTDLGSQHRIMSKVRELVEAGGVVITEAFAGEESRLDEWSTALSDQGLETVVENLGGGDMERRIDMFVGTMEPLNNPERTVRKADSFYEVFQAAVERGELSSDPEKNAVVERVIEGQEAEDLWSIYENPFLDLGEQHPIQAGFEKDDFLELLKTPEYDKIVFRAEGEIVALTVFLNNLELVPWFNEQYFKDRYPEFSDTDNVLVFPGIVSDERKRGLNYSLPIVQLVPKLLTERNTDCLIVFECSEVSATYIPTKVVKPGVEATGLAKMNGLEQAVSTLQFKALRAA